MKGIFQQPVPHTHDWNEAYFITVGEVHFSVRQQSFTASAGDFVYAPGSVPHGFWGASEQPARVLIFDAPAHTGIFFKRVSREVKDLPRDLPKVMGIA